MCSRKPMIRAMNLLCWLTEHTFFDFRYWKPCNTIGTFCFDVATNVRVHHLQTMAFSKAQKALVKACLVGFPPEVWGMCKASSWNFGLFKPPLKAS